MKLCRFNDNNAEPKPGPRLGVVDAGTIYDVTSAADALGSHNWPFPKGGLAIANLPRRMEAARALMPRADRYEVGSVALLSPTANPTKIIGAPINYEEHRVEANRDQELHQNTHQTKFEGFASPIAKLGLFLKSSSSVVGPGEGMSVTFPDRRSDHEVELAVVIGQEAKNIEADEAFNFVAGYCIGLDMSVRGTESRSMRKSPDGYSVLGPWLVTPDEIPDPGSLDFWIKVNGVERQKSNTRNLTVSVPDLIALASRWYTLYPGDVIMTGTPEGVAPVAPGDVMVAHIDGIGTMSVAVG
jgi:2-keto-4-pentenoate hydratase/2-oxohepta-3-ene-1,7-dioic acid hydratase in catechol pathway